MCIEPMTRQFKHIHPHPHPHTHTQDKAKMGSRYIDIFESHPGELMSRVGAAAIALAAKDDVGYKGVYVCVCFFFFCVCFFFW